jgi:hypothetical protein
MTAMVTAMVTPSYACCACKVSTAGLSLHSQVSTSASTAISHMFASSRQTSARHGRYRIVPNGSSPPLLDEFVFYRTIRDHIALYLA